MTPLWTSSKTTSERMELASNTPTRWSTVRPQRSSRNTKSQSRPSRTSNSMSNQTADLIAYNGKIATQNEQRPMVEAVAVLDGKFLAIGTDREVMAYRGEQTQLINLNKRTAIPGLNDSHTHLKIGRASCRERV